MQTLSYENFGKTFMESYCTDCHDSKLRGEDRQGAPSFHDFDTIYGIRAVWEHIDFTTAAGPTSIVNDSMPPSGEPQPTLAEREQLGEWIACEMPTLAEREQLGEWIACEMPTDAQLMMQSSSR